MIFINSSSVVADNNPKGGGLGLRCLEQEDITSFCVNVWWMWQVVISLVGRGQEIEGLYSVLGEGPRMKGGGRVNQHPPVWH